MPKRTQLGCLSLPQPLSCVRCAAFWSWLVQKVECCRACSAGCSPSAAGQYSNLPPGRGRAGPAVMVYISGTLPLLASRLRCAGSISCRQMEPVSPLTGDRQTHIQLRCNRTAYRLQGAPTGSRAARAVCYNLGLSRSSVPEMRSTYTPHITQCSTTNEKDAQPTLESE